MHYPVKVLCTIAFAVVGATFAIVFRKVEVKTDYGITLVEWPSIETVLVWATALGLLGWIAISSTDKEA